MALNDEDVMALKDYFDSAIDTNWSLDSLGIDSEKFKDEFRETLVSRIQDFASEKLEQ